MAYWVMEAGSRNNARYRAFYADTVADIDNLPTATQRGVEQDTDSVSCQRCSAGSSCFVLEDSSVYILSKDTNTWEEV